MINSVAKEPLDVMTIIQSRAIVEGTYEWRKWGNEIPAIQFPAEYQVRVIPPFGGAIVRFVVFSADMSQRVSVYLDCYDELGLFGEPYWEMYPTIEDDTFRCKMNDVDLLLTEINSVLGAVH